MKKKGVFAEPESDLEDEWVASHEETLQELEIERAKKRFEKVYFSFFLSPDRMFIERDLW